MISWRRAGGASCSDCRQRSRSARALNETMTIERSMAGSHPRRLFDRGERLARRPAASCIGPAPPAPPPAARARRFVEQQLFERVARSPSRSPLGRRARRRRSSRARPAYRAGPAGRRPRAPRAASGRGPRIPTETRRRAPADTDRPAARPTRTRCQRIRPPASAAAIAPPTSSRGKLRLSPARSRDASGCCARHRGERIGRDRRHGGG